MRAPPIVSIECCASASASPTKMIPAIEMSASAQGFEREQAVIDRAEARARDEYDRQAPAFEHVDGQRAVAERRHHAAGRLYDERTVAWRRIQRGGVDFDALVARGKMRRGRSTQPPGFWENTVGRRARKPRDDLRVRLAIEARLHRLPVIGVERADERGGDDGLADAVSVPTITKRRFMVRASRALAPRCAIMRATSSSLACSVSAMRKRAEPSGTVGGRMARMS